MLHYPLHCKPLVESSQNKNSPKPQPPIISYQLHSGFKTSTSSAFGFHWKEKFSLFFGVFFFSRCLAQRSSLPLFFLWPFYHGVFPSPSQQLISLFLFPFQVLIHCMFVFCYKKWRACFCFGNYMLWSVFHCEFMDGSKMICVMHVFFYVN